jgi:hypothetical protein
MKYDSTTQPKNHLFLLHIKGKIPFKSTFVIYGKRPEYPLACREE